MPDTLHPSAALPSFYGQTQDDGTVVQRPSTSTPQLVDSRPPSVRSDGALHRRRWAMHRPGPVAVDRHRNYNGAIGGYQRQRPSTNRRQESSSSSSSDDSEDSETLRRRRKERRKAKRARLEEIEASQPLRIPWTTWMASESKNHLVAVIGEFIGTFLFLFFAFAGTGVANIGNNTENQTTTAGATSFNLTSQLYISLSFGFSLMVNAWVFFRISGGLFNPAVTLALALLRAVHMGRAVLLFLAQISGACFASYIVKVLFPTEFNVQTTLSPDTSLAQGIFIEAICTAMLVFTIVMLAKEKHKATFIAPVGIGLALFIGELVSVYYTGGALNPARAFGPAAVTHNFVSNHWVYWVGPGIGALFAIAFYQLIKLLEYELANPGQDGDEKNNPLTNPEHELHQVVQEREAEVKEIRELQEELAVPEDEVPLDSQTNLAEIANKQGEVAEKQGEVADKQDEVADSQADVVQEQKKAANQLADVAEEVKEIKSHN